MFGHQYLIGAITEMYIKHPSPGETSSLILDTSRTKYVHFQNLQIMGIHMILCSKSYPVAPKTTLWASQQFALKIVTKIAIGSNMALVALLAI